MSNDKSSERAKFTIERVYLTSKPISINSPSMPESVTQSSEDSEFTREDFEHTLKKASRPNKAPHAARKSRT